MGHRLRRKGSLGWYHNSATGLRTIVPTDPKKMGIYGIKVGMITQVLDGILTPITLVELLQMKRNQNNQYEMKFPFLKNPTHRTFNCNLEYKDLKNEVISSSYLDVTAQSKGKGTLGPIQRRNIKMQKRKAAKSGVTRKAGSMGLREPGRVVWTKPMSGKTGNSRRTIYSLKNFGTVTLKDYQSLRYYVKEAQILKIKGAVPGAIGRPVLVKKASRR